MAPNPSPSAGPVIPFKLKNRVAQDFQDLSRVVTMECDKSPDEARGETRLAIGKAETGWGMPILLTEPIIRTFPRLLLLMAAAFAGAFAFVLPGVGGQAGTPHSLVTVMAVDLLLSSAASPLTCPLASCQS